VVGQEVRSGKGRGLPQEMVMCGRRGRDRRGRVREGEGERGGERSGRSVRMERGGALGG